jgi:hypothetical protein
MQGVEELFSNLEIRPEYVPVEAAAPGPACPGGPV